MEVTECKYCGVHVVAVEDGTCPSCRRPLEDSRVVTVEETLPQGALEEKGYIAPSENEAHRGRASIANMADRVCKAYRWYRNFMTLSLPAGLLAGTVFLVAQLHYLRVMRWDSFPDRHAYMVFCASLIISFMAFMVAGVLGWMLLYRAWQSIQDGKARTTPGKAVGYCFIPVFGVFWQIRAFLGLSVDMNRYLDANKVDVPRLKETTAGLFCGIPFFGLLLSFCFRSISELATNASSHDITLFLFFGTYAGLAFLSAILHWILMASFSRSTAAILRHASHE